MPSHFLNASGRLGSSISAVKDQIDRWLPPIAESLGIDSSSIDLVFRDAPFETVQELGIGGLSLDGFTIFMSLDIARIGDVLPQQLPLTLAHELHHVARRRLGLDPRTLLDALVTEGLADHFAGDIVGAPGPRWTKPFGGPNGMRIAARAEQEYDHICDWPRWFFGAGDLPRWAGYAVGFHLVGQFLRAHEDQTAASLVGAPAALFVSGREPVPVAR
ncbi:MAG: hypothetical protein QOH16_694 [Gaiellaceae bacterium]|nr:hypothetical protein [Gaiellaceae bacterium]